MKLKSDTKSAKKVLLFIKYILILISKLNITAILNNILNSNKIVTIAINFFLNFIIDISIIIYKDKN